MGVFSKMIQATSVGLQAGIIAARRVFEDPASAYQQRSFQAQAIQYSLLWSYYNNSMFEKIPHIVNLAGWSGNNSWGPWAVAQSWAAYKANYNLYRNIRLIYNPTRRLVDFYAGQIYPGVLSEDGQSLPDGVPLAVPFAKDTDPSLKAAVAQFWQWSNWQAKKSLQVRYGAALGSVFTELVDDLEHGKICAEIPWPGFISNLELDSAGNVKAYAIQYQAHDGNESYLYCKEVDADAFRYYRDGEPFDYGYGAIVENPYGFVPATWTKHVDVGGDHGSPAIAGSFGKIDELNNLVSHIHDQIHKVIGAPVVLWSSGSVQSLFGTKKRGSTFDFDEPSSDQESVLMLKGPADGKVDSLAGNLDLAAADVHVGRLLAEIEDSHPELTFYKMLRQMSQVTGPAAERLAGDVTSRVIEAQAAYDQANIKLFQMATAMAGFRANSSSWGSLNRQQQKFTPFGLDSYERGDLDMAIMPRPILKPTKTEVAMEKQAMWTGVKLATEAGVPLELALRDEGWTEEELQALQDATDREAKAQVDQIQRQQFLAQSDTIPMVNQ
jgi:hypothetical protein